MPPFSGGVLYRTSLSDRVLSDSGGSFFGRHPRNWLAVRVDGFSGAGLQSAIA
jgi:hypothetical protein